jgi:hypothetical protein
MLKPSDAESAQRMVSMLTVEQIHNVFENLEGEGTREELGPEYVDFLRGMLLRRLDSIRRGRRGLMSVPALPGS